MARASSSVIVLCLCALLGCSVPPSEKTVSKSITDYFEHNGYKVLNLKIGKIEGMPLSAKTYMGTPGYGVDIISITLEPQEDKGADVKKGREITFSNANVRVIQDRTNKDEWHVTIISGISLP